MSTGRPIWIRRFRGSLIPSQVITDKSVRPVRVFFIQETLYDAFLQRLKDKVESVILGSSRDPSTQVSSVIDRDAADKIMGYIDQAPEDGWQLESGGGYWNQEERIIKPTIFSSQAKDAYLTKLAQEEIFGPVLAVMPANNLDHALEMINSTEFGLTAGIFSRNEKNKDTFKDRVEAGVIYINRKITAAAVGLVGFGGGKSLRNRDSGRFPGLSFSVSNTEKKPNPNLGRKGISLSVCLRENKRNPRIGFE